jgi:hypothetical protein
MEPMDIEAPKIHLSPGVGSRFVTVTESLAKFAVGAAIQGQCGPGPGCPGNALPGVADFTL